MLVSYADRRAEAIVTTIVAMGAAIPCMDDGNTNHP
jgi:hypothetical protein